MVKEKKTNIRSFRYSDRVAEIIESSDGATLNEKFENLVLFCFDELPVVKKELDMYKRWVKEEKESYYRLDKMNRNFNEIMSGLEEAKEKLDLMVSNENM